MSVRPSVRPSVCPPVRPSVRPDLRNKMCPRRFLRNRLAECYEIWHAISPILLVDAQHFKLFFCLIFQTLFRHFRPHFQFITDSTSLQWAAWQNWSTLCSNLILLTLSFYSLYFNIYFYY